MDVNRRRLSDYSWPDSRVTVSWYDGDGAGFVASSRVMSERGVGSVHRMSPLVVWIAGDRGWGEAAATIEARAVVEGVLANLVSATRLNYHVARRDRRWGIVSLNAVYEHETLTAAVAGMTLAVGR